MDKLTTALGFCRFGEFEVFAVWTVMESIRVKVSK